MSRNHESKFTVSRIIVLAINLLNFAGIGVALYLTWLHYQVHTNPAFHSFCAMNDAFNCETVAESPYSVFFGLPVAVWGLLGYLLMLLVGVFGVGMKQAAAAYLLLLGAAACSVLTSLVLAIVSYCIICSFCVMCSVTYGINTILFAVLVWQALAQRFAFKQAADDLFFLVRRYKVMLLLLFLAAALLCLLFPKYWDRADSAAHHGAGQGTTADGHHWIGARMPALVVVEFSDYLCPHCRRAHSMQRALVSANPERLRLVHRHFPLDDSCNPLIETPFHPGSCLLSRAALCAGKQQRFWEMNDLLYSPGDLSGATWEEKVEVAAQHAGLNISRFRECLASPETQKELDQDIAEGLRLELNGTPSFVVNGQIHLGMIPPGVFAEHGIEMPAR